MNIKLKSVIIGLFSLFNLNYAQQETAISSTINPNAPNNGDGTAFGGSVVGGSCSFKKIWSVNTMNFFNHGVAMNSAQYDNSLACGTCVKIYFNNLALMALVLDKCPECKQGDLDMFLETWQTIIQADPARKHIVWEFLPCPSWIVSGNVNLRIDEINVYHLAVQPENFKCKIKEMHILQDGNWLKGERDDTTRIGLYFTFKDRQLKPPFRFKLTNLYDEELESDNLQELTNIITLNGQFLCNTNKIEHKESDILPSNISKYPSGLFLSDVYHPNYEDHINSTLQSRALQSNQTTQPVTTQPVTTQPITIQPVTTQPVTTQPVTTQPVNTQNSNNVNNNNIISNLNNVLNSNNQKISYDELLNIPAIKNILNSITDQNLKQMILNYLKDFSTR